MRLDSKVGRCHLVGLLRPRLSWEHSAGRLWNGPAVRLVGHTGGPLTTPVPPIRTMKLQPLYGRSGELPVRSTRSGRRMARDMGLTPEIVARMDEALRVRPVEDLPSASATPLYELLVANGFDRRDVLELAASLVDLVTSDVIS